MKTRPVDPYVTCNAKAFAALKTAALDHLHRLSIEKGLLKKRLSRSDAKSQEQVLAALIADLYLASNVSSDLCLGINLNKSWYTANRALLPSWKFGGM